MLFTIFQSVIVSNNRFLSCILFCFIITTNSQAQNLLILNNNNPGFEGTGGFQANGYTNISPGTSGTSSPSNYAITGDSGPMNLTSFKSVTPHSGTKMMVVDANNQIFWQGNPNIPLVGGVTYTFSYWVVNVNKNGTSNPAFPNPIINFVAVDQCGCTPVLKSGSSSPTVNNGTWQQVIYEFTPSGTGIKYVRFELSTPGATPNGNDFAIDDISLIAPPLPLAISASQTNVSCPGLTDASISAYGFGGVEPYSYTLTNPMGVTTPPSATGIFTNLSAGSYTVSVIDNNTPVGNKSTVTVISPIVDMTIAASTVASPALVPATSTQPINTTICSGIPITLMASNMSGYTWTSTPADPSLTTPSAASITVTPTVNTVYKVTANGPSGALTNLIYNGDFEKDTAGFSSSYAYYATNAAFVQRAYGVISNPNTWGSVYDVATDHTNPGTGKMFITDGSTIPGDKVWGQNLAVKVGISYEFKYYIRSITTGKGNPARMQLKINGVILNNSLGSATDTAPLNTANGWLLYTHMWLANSTIATVELYNLEINGSGNDFGLDDITFIPLGASTCTPIKEITVTISSGTSDTAFTYPTTVCKSATSVLPNKTNLTTFTPGGTWSQTAGTGTLSIISSTGEINPSLSTSGTYTVKYAVPLVGCQPASSSTFSITISPQSNAGSDGFTTVCDSSSAVINLSGLITGQQSGGVWLKTAGSGGIFDATAGTFKPAPSATSSTFTYTITGSAPCPNDSSIATVNINPVITPTINCGTSTTSSVEFTWDPVTNATDYSVSYKINASPTVTIGTIGNVLKYPVSSLTSGDNVTITVTPLGGSGTCFTPNTKTCTASNCVQPTATINYPSSPFCISNTTPQLVTLTGTGAYATGNYSAVGLTINSSSGSITPSANAAGPYIITYEIKGISGCPPVIATTPIVIKAQPDSGTDGSISVCENDTTVINLFNLITGEQAGGVWTKTTGSGGNFNAGAGTFTPLPGATTSSFTYTLDNSPCNDSSVATVTINPLPVLKITCGTPSSSSVTFDWNSIADATSYNYSYTIDSGAPITGVLPASAITLTVNGLTQGQNVSILLTPTGSACAKPAPFNCVSSNCPTPKVDVISSFPSCANDNVSIPTFTSVTSGVTFKWTNTNTSIGIAASGTGATIPTFKVLNSTNILQKATISVTAKDATCTGQAMVFTIDVYPLPTASISVAKSSVCSGQETTIVFIGTPGATVTYNEDSSGLPQNLVLDASGNASLLTGNITANTLYSLISIEDSAKTCSQTLLGTTTVNINPLPTVAISGTTSVCSGTGTSIQFNNGTPNAIVTYTINSGLNQTIDLDAIGEATLPTGNLTANTVYDLVSVLDKTTTCSQLQSGNATVTVDPLPTVAISGTTSICTGTGTSIQFNNGTPKARVTYTINSGTNQTIDLDAIGEATLLTGNLISNTVYKLVNVRDISTTCFQAKSEAATVTIISLPTATISGTTPICSGSGTSIQFNNGTPNAKVTYTINSGLNQTIDLDTAGNATLPTGNLIANTDYNLVSVEDSTKTCSQTLSGTATVSINPLPTVSISSSSPICSGSSTKVEFKGTPNAVVTYKVNSGAPQTINLDAFGDATLLTGNLISNTIYILESVSDTITFCSQPQSGNAIVTITSLPKVELTGTTSICSGAASSITFTGTPNTTVTYKVNLGADQTIDIDATGETILPTGILTSNTEYSLVSILDVSTKCSQLQTGTATISINAAPDVVPATTNQPICSGQSSGVLLTSTTLGTVFNWTVIESGVIGATIGAGNNISQVLNTTSPINVGTAAYTVTPTANGCSGVPALITVSVSPTPAAIATVDKDVICSGATTSIALSSGNTQTTFSWNTIQNNVTGATQDSGNIIAQVLQTSLNNFGEAVYAITPSLNGCNGLTILVPITVNPVPNVSTNIFNNPICSGTATNIELTSNVPGTTFTWSVAQTNVIGAVPGNGDSIAQIIETTGNSLGIGEYTITPQINSCIGNPVIVPIQVNPTPEVFAPASTTICSGESPKISLIPLIIGTSFSWKQLSDKVTGSSDGNGTVIDQFLTAENNPGKVEYTVTPELGLCIGKSRVITVFVNPSPSVNLENGVLCLEANGDLKKSLILDTNLSDNLYDFEWYFNNSTNPIPGATDSSYEATELGEYFVNVKFTSTGCSIKSNTSTVTEVNPTNSFEVDVSDAFTENASITVTGQNAITTYLYQIDDGALQNSNVFNGIGAGIYTIRVTDSDGCTDFTKKDVLVIDYPKYFTPNGDGFNDTWNIKGLSDQTNVTLLIYDRYGKLLKQISPKGQGWDGTFNGVQLPATDYWFTVDYKEPNNDLNKLFKEHFSLKR